MESIEYDFVLGRDYPYPIVDVESANRKSREILYGIKKSLDPESKKTLLEKHGSRKKNYRKKASSKKTRSASSDNLSLFDELTSSSHE
jgi:deoxyribodipyrimidine photo-lyase